MTHETASLPGADRLTHDWQYKQLEQKGAAILELEGLPRFVRAGIAGLLDRARTGQVDNWRRACAQLDALVAAAAKAGCDLYATDTPRQLDLFQIEQVDLF